MSRVVLGAICGLIFGAIDVGIMLPMTFPDKKAAITAAFIARFGIGFVIGTVRAAVCVDAWGGPLAVARVVRGPTLWTPTEYPRRHYH